MADSVRTSRVSTAPSVRQWSTGCQAMGRLSPSALRAICDPATLQFRSPAELAPPDGMKTLRD